MHTRLVGSAHLIEGSARALPKLLHLLEHEGIATKRNADVYVREYARFGIDDARELRDKAATRAVSSSHRVFIITTPSMTSDAQNALLKTLEESPAGAMFFFIVPSPQTLRPTLRSRMQMLTLPREEDEGLVDSGAFLAAAREKRIEMLKPLFEKDEDDKRDLRPVLMFLSSLESRLAKVPEGLEAVYRARKYIGDKGALLKPLLEQVALLLPVLK